MIIDGKKCSEEILENLKKEVSEYKERIGKIPGLAVIILGDNPASKIYVRSKIRACEKVGIYSKEIVLSDKISEAELIKEIEKLNSDKDINGILVQLPLPEHINEKKICDAISIRKDVEPGKGLKKLEEINRIIFFLNRKDELKKIKKGDVSGLNMHLRKETNINTDRFAGKYELLNYLNGYRAFIISAMKYSEDENFLSKSKNKIEKLEDIVNKIAK